MTPMITRDAPRLICASSPNSRTRVTISLDLFLGGVGLGDNDHIPRRGMIRMA